MHRANFRYLNKSSKHICTQLFCKYHSKPCQPQCLLVSLLLMTLLSLATTLAADLGSVGLGGLYKILDLQCLFQLELHAGLLMRR